MISCFLQHDNHLIPTPLTLLLITFFIATSQSQKITYLTSSTNCSITFQTNTTDVNNKMYLTSCVQMTCLRNLINGNCANPQTFELDTQKCLHQCCGTNQFDSIKCQQFNKKRLIQHQSLDQKLMIVLIGCMIGLLAAVIVFSIVYMRCCGDEEERESSKNKENFFQWKECQFTTEKECQECKNKGAFVMLACGVFFHLKCINNNEKWTCTHCQKEIKKVKVFCPICLKRSIVIQSFNFYELDKKINEMYELHPEKCIEHMGEEMDTERKLTQSTKQ